MHDTSTRSPGLRFLTPEPDRLDRADRFVAEDPARRDRRDVALQDVQVGAADRDRIDPNDGVGVLDNCRLRDLLPRLVAGTVIDDALACPDLLLDNLRLHGRRYERCRPLVGPFGPIWGP